MSETAGRSPVHLIIETFERAFEALGVGASPLFIERRGIAVHHCLSSRAREFHTHRHVLDLSREADPLETLAALYHDVVYVQVDLGVPERFAALLKPLVSREAEGWRLLPRAEADPAAAIVLGIFGRGAGDALTPLAGLNELASALVAVKELEEVLDRRRLLSIVACIEATIPFREEVGWHLVRRLGAVGLPPPETGEIVRRAVRLANNDVGNFAEADPARFLDNTWRLLPETNPALHATMQYSVRDYRSALENMEGFLAGLPAERVFHRWEGEPAPAEHARRVAAAGRNIALARRYLRCKLYSIALVEALAEETGGDAPLDLFTGGFAEPGAPSLPRVEEHLPELPRAGGVDPTLLGLLVGGRSSSSSFDTPTSPLAGFVLTVLGEPAVSSGFEQARAWWAGDSSARGFLEAQPRASTAALAEAMARIAETRADSLRALVRALP